MHEMRGVGNSRSCCSFCVWGTTGYSEGWSFPKVRSCRSCGEQLDLKAGAFRSEEEAKKKIYNVSFEKYFGFGCDIDEETSNKLEGLPGVLFVIPDLYVDPEHKDYGGELFVNGEIVQRPPERQRRVDPQPQRHQDKPRYNDRTRSGGRCLSAEYTDRVGELAKKHGLQLHIDGARNFNTSVMHILG